MSAFMYAFNNPLTIVRVLLMLQRQTDTEVCMRPRMKTRLSTSSFWRWLASSFQLSSVAFLYTIYISSCKSGCLFEEFRPHPNSARSTNQTTIENINPFLLLAHLPAPPTPPTGEDASPHRLLEHELSFDQRRIVREAHGQIRLYDLGWKRNFAQIFGWERKEGWVKRILTGGAGYGSLSLQHYISMLSIFSVLSILW
jgi:hypothetical protein